MASSCLGNRILVKCGGFSSHLANVIGQEIDGDPLWGSRFDAENPTAVVQTHLEFLENGAQIILSNTYQSSLKGFMEHLKLTKEESIQLMRKSVQLAKEAKMKFIGKLQNTNGNKVQDLPLIMASIGAYGAHLHDGSEYNGSYAKHISSKEIQDWHRTRIEACLAEKVDGLAIETIPCRMEAEAVVDMIIGDYPDTKFWVSFQCKDEKTLAHGENFSDAVLSIWNRVKAKNATDRLYAIGVNCVNPKFVTPLLQSVRDKTDNNGHGECIPFIVYSNRGETYDRNACKWMENENVESFVPNVPTWIKLGAKIVGGCCRVYPADIRRIRECVDNITRT